jgi:hypothetical protein
VYMNIRYRPAIYKGINVFNKLIGPSRIMCPIYQYTR